MAGEIIDPDARFLDNGDGQISLNDFIEGSLEDKQVVASTLCAHVTHVCVFSVAACKSAPFRHQRFSTLSWSSESTGRLAAGDESRGSL